MVYLVYLCFSLLSLSWLNFPLICNFSLFLRDELIHYIVQPNLCDNFSLLLLLNPMNDVVSKT